MDSESWRRDLLRQSTVRSGQTRSPAKPDISLLVLHLFDAGGRAGPGLRRPHERPHLFRWRSSPGQRQAPSRARSQTTSAPALAAAGGDLRGRHGLHALACSPKPAEKGQRRRAGPDQPRAAAKSLSARPLYHHKSISIDSTRSPHACAEPERMCVLRLAVGAAHTAIHFPGVARGLPPRGKPPPYNQHLLLRN